MKMWGEKKTKLFLSLTAGPRPGSKIKTLKNPPWTCRDQTKCPHFAGEMLTMLHLQEYTHTHIP